MNSSPGHLGAFEVLPHALFLYISSYSHVTRADAVLLNSHPESDQCQEGTRFKPGHLLCIAHEPDRSR